MLIYVTARFDVSITTRAPRQNLKSLQLLNMTDSAMEQVTPSFLTNCGNCQMATQLQRIALQIRDRSKTQDDKEDHDAGRQCQQGHVSPIHYTGEDFDFFTKLWQHYLTAIDYTERGAAMLKEYNTQPLFLTKLAIDQCKISWQLDVPNKKVWQKVVSNHDASIRSG